MSQHEMEAYLQYSNYSSRQQWEMTRQQMYITAQANSKKKLKPSDVMTFAWDSERLEADERARAEAASNRERERLMAVARQLQSK